MQTLVTIRELTADEVTFDYSVEQDDLAVLGNAIDSGEDAFDCEVEDEILARLASGDVWAWCVLTVTAEWQGFVGQASLGGCSYADREDFEACDYNADLHDEALADLNSKVRAQAATLLRLAV